MTSVQTPAIFDIALKLDHGGVDALPDRVALRIARGIEFDCAVARDLGSAITVLLHEKVRAAPDVDVPT